LDYDCLALSWNSHICVICKVLKEFYNASKVDRYEHDEVPEEEREEEHQEIQKKKV